MPISIGSRYPAARVGTAASARLRAWPLPLHSSALYFRLLGCFGLIAPAGGSMSPQIEHEETMSMPAAEAAAPRPRKPVQAWDQQPGENNLWYARFLRFVAIGPSEPVGPRSVSLVSKGRKNAYAVPAHWPMVAKERHWRERAAAFDEAARRDETVVKAFNLLLGAFQQMAPESEARLLQGLTYNRPQDDEETE